MKEALIEQGVQRHHIEASTVRREAEAEIRKFLPPLPRAAKRVLNHLRVMLVVADRRGIIGGDPPLTGRHIGKWVLLRVRWPELAAAVANRPRLMRELEAASDPTPTLQDLGLISADLVGFVQGETKLDPAVERLTHFAPALRAVATERKQSASEDVPLVVEPRDGGPGVTVRRSRRWRPPRSGIRRR